jgi:hypothetical protein
MGFTKQNINKSIIHSILWQSLAIEYIQLYFFGNLGKMISLTEFSSLISNKQEKKFIPTMVMLIFNQSFMLWKKLSLVGFLKTICPN